MLLIPCVYCGPRDETEFHYGGQAHVAYPENPAELTDAEWAQFLFYRDNPKGPFAERWMHRTGCRQWFNIVRDTVTYEILAAYAVGDSQPDVAAAGATPDSGIASTAAERITLSSAAPDLSGVADAVAHPTYEEADR